MNKKDISYILKVAKSCDLSGDYVLADKFSKLLEKNYRYSQTQLTLDNFVDSLFNFVDRNKLRDPNGNISFIDAFDRYSNFNANINNVNINNIPALVNLKNIVANNPGKVYMPDELRNILRGNVSSNPGNANNSNAGNNNQNNNIFASNSPNEFATKLFQFARNNNFNNLTRALESYMFNASYNGAKINYNQQFVQLYTRVRATNSVITESMLANELSMILGGENNNVGSMGNQGQQNNNTNSPNNPYDGDTSFEEMRTIIFNSPIEGLDSLVAYIDKDRFLTPEQKEDLKKIINTRKLV
jgi:hypothetical protein